MHDLSIRGPWRVLILDRSGDDPKWIIATVSLSSDVRGAEMEPGGWRYAGWPAVTEWVSPPGRPARPARTCLSDRLAHRRRGQRRLMTVAGLARRAGAGPTRAWR